jgi:putative DNA primase/helicase
VERDSGKTTLLGVISFLVRRALNSVEISGAALFRSIAKWQPTIILDEADDVLNDNADLRSVLNSGWTRGQTVIRCHPDTHEPESFPTFGPKALGMKGDNLPDTTLSRSLAIDMKPKLKGEEIADFNHLDNESFAQLRRQLLRWATDNAEALAARQPEIPQDFHNRRRANWRPLLAIAEQMEMKQAGLQAALEIEQRQIAADPSTGIQLLTAIRFIFDEMEADHLVLGQAEKDRITTARLVQELIDLPDSRWGTYGRNDKPITTAQVTRLLKPYGIRSGSVRIPKDGGTTPKGFLRAWFEDAFTRYLPPAADLETASDFSEAQNPPSEPDTPDTTLKTKGFSPETNPTQDLFVSSSKSEIPIENQHCVGCVGLEGGFSSGEKADRPGDALEARSQDIPTDRTCAQCKGEIDGTERLVSVSGQAVWLHAVCERFWLRTLEGER